MLPLVKSELANVSSARQYLFIYHEAVVINLLEVMMYHSSTSETIGDLLIDLIEYAYRKIIKLIGYKHAETKVSQTNEEDLDRQMNEMEFAIGISCISLIRFISDHLSSLTLAVVQ